jgi:hypothetical protein
MPILRSLAVYVYKYDTVFLHAEYIEEFFFFPSNNHSGLSSLLYAYSADVVIKVVGIVRQWETAPCIFLCLPNEI